MYVSLREKEITDVLRENCSNALLISESYIIGIDIATGTDESMVTVVKQIGNRLEYVNTITGKDAELMYKKLTNKSWRDNCNE